MKSGFIFLITLVLMMACAPEDPVDPDTGLDYFPLKVGNQWLYQVEETNINQSIEVSSQYELRVSVADSFKNMAGGYTYILHRETRSSETNPWQSIDTWSAWFSSNRIVQNEANVSFVKLLFPPSAGSYWNGNQFNNLPDNGNLFNGPDSESYQLTEIDMPMTLANGLEFPQTLTVVQNEFEDNIVGNDLRREVYAREVGLIYKEVMQLEYCSTPACLGQQIVDKGVIYIQTLKAHASQ